MHNVLPTLASDVGAQDSAILNSLTQSISHIGARIARPPNTQSMYRPIPPPLLYICGHLQSSSPLLLLNAMLLSIRPSSFSHTSSIVQKLWEVGSHWRLPPSLPMLRALSCIAHCPTHSLWLLASLAWPRFR